MAAATQAWPIRAVIDRDTGLLRDVRQVLSPHHDQRPADCTVDLIVIHGISLPPGEFGGAGIDQLFCGDLPATAHAFFATIAGLRVSAHACIDRAGRVTQYVPFQCRAWHAGVSSWRGRAACNDFSIGIELEGSDDTPYTAAQYHALAALIVALQRVFPTIANDHLAGHSDIAPGRKTDPGASFDWLYLQQLLQAERGLR